MKYPGMIIHSIGTVIAGIWFSAALFHFLWPDIEQYNKTTIKSNNSYMRNIIYNQIS